LQPSKLPLTSWFLAMPQLIQSKTKVSASELVRHLGVCYRSAWRLKHKMLERMRLAEADRGSENQVPFVDAVQAP
jgi:hypothetical protein